MSEEIYTEVKNNMDNWRDNIYQESEKSFETQIEEFVFESYNNDTYIGLDDMYLNDGILEIAIEISKYYENELGTAFKLHKYTGNHIINIFALLCAENIKQDMIMQHPGAKQ